MTNRAYQQTLQNSLQRKQADHAEIKEQYEHAPQHRQARQQEASPELYHSSKTRAAQARLGAWVMWGLCAVIGSYYMAQTFSLPGLSPEANAVAVTLLWIVLTILLGLAGEMVVEFGLDIRPRAPNSDRRALRGILIGGLGTLLTFAALLILRAWISLPVQIVMQACFELFCVITGSFFRALSAYYAHLPALRDRLEALQDEIDQLTTDLASIAETPAPLAANAPVAFTQNGHAAKPAATNTTLHYS
jgi:hypothetical protein